MKTLLKKIRSLWGRMRSRWEAIRSFARKYRSPWYYWYTGNRKIAIQTWGLSAAILFTIFVILTSGGGLLWFVLLALGFALEAALLWLILVLIILSFMFPFIWGIIGGIVTSWVGGVVLGALWGLIMGRILARFFYKRQQSIEQAEKTPANMSTEHDQIHHSQSENGQEYSNNLTLLQRIKLWLKQQIRKAIGATRKFLSRFFSTKIKPWGQRQKDKVKIFIKRPGLLVSLWKWPLQKIALLLRRLKERKAKREE